ncbi:MAG: hypothetical protein IJW36_03590 [Clostridia bacterium]|nr:hypothetical protein [Clostridia bacterium]
MNNDTRLAISAGVGAGVGAGIATGSVACANKFLSNFSKGQDKLDLKKLQDLMHEGDTFLRQQIEKGTNVKTVHGNPVFNITDSLGKSHEFTIKSLYRLINLVRNKGKVIAVATAACGAIGLGVGAIINSCKKNKDAKQ